MPELYFLLERAFAPAFLPRVHLTWFHELYRGEAPEYGSTLSKGTVSTLEHFTLEEKETLEKLNSQFVLLIDFLKSECIRLRINDGLEAVPNDFLLDDFAPEEKVDLLDNLNIFSTRYTSRTFYANEDRIFYTHVKKEIETIVFQVRHNTLLHDIEKRRILQYLLRQIIYCAGGVVGHLETAKINLCNSETVDAWLAKFRLTIIQQLASDYIRKNLINAGLEIHIESIFLKYASNMGWNPYGFEFRSWVEDNFASLARVPHSYLEINFKEGFLQHYNPSTIIEELTTCLHSHIGKRLQTKDSPYAQEEDQKTVINLPSLPDFRKFFENIPFITESNINIMYDIFTLELPSDSSLFFKLGEERLYLKPLSELKRAMIEIFIKTNTHFFEIYYDKYYTLVPHCLDLCYQHNAEKPPLEISLKALEFLRHHDVHFNQCLFILFYQNNVRNFSNCLLDNVDFSEVDIESLNLTGSTLHFQKEITPDEFIFLFKSCASPVFRAIESLENIEEALFKEASSEKSPTDKGILLFYAIAINSPFSITRLLAAGADATVEDHLTRTPIYKAAVKFKRWECVKALATAKAQDDSLILAIAASEKRWDIVEILLDTKTDPNYQPEAIDDECTALHFAARTNNVCMVQKLLKAGANPNLKTCRGKKTPLEEAIELGHRECIPVLQNAGFKKLYHLIQKSLPSSIKSPFLQFYSALRKDSFTSPLPKNIITEHFIYFLEESIEKYKEEKQDEKERENEIRESLYQSRNDLQEQLEGKPTVFNGLTIALEHFFENLLPENHLLRLHRTLPPLYTLSSDSSSNFVR
ncbi:MAG: Ankyrin repeat (3 copies) [Gammaproteobacteria bacterium]|jgi:hypothetical protein|nr:Ankyrin repeat (3 copies) [Gammaproteobacteria bacterium]